MGVATAALLLAPLSIARAGIIQPELSVVGGTGLPGGTVSVTLNLSDDVDDAAVSVGVFLRFDDSVLNFSLPVAGSCTLADRIQGTHQVAGNILEPGLVDIEVLVSGSPSPVPPLGNGEIVTCDFGIEPGVPAGTSAIEIESPLLGDAEGDPIPVRTQDGQVEIILEPPTATPTATGTPENTPTATPTLPATATVTDTPVTPPSATPSVTPTNTTSPVTPPTSTATATVTKTITPPTIAATSTPTATNTTPPTPTRTGNTPTPTRKSAGGDDGCNIVPNGHSEANGMLALLLAPALLLWVRRRS